jgi:hypothetical protein
MWLLYGESTSGDVVRFGNEPAYFEWMGLKIMWTNDMKYKEEFKNKLINFPVSSNGYVWSWTNQERWPTPPEEAFHFDNNPKYILGVYRYLMWTRDLSILNMTDERGYTVLGKLRLAMHYMLTTLHGGSEGILIIDNGENNGTVKGLPSNYWDNLRFGYKDAYDSIYFFASLKAMKDIEQMLGNVEEATKYDELIQKSRSSYDKNFWDDKKGRYIGCVDVEGHKWDFGFTFLNLEALAYGLGNKTKANLILSWLDGKRIINGDTSIGKDIYFFRIAPRSTTKAIESEGPPYWWYSLGGKISVGPGGNANFGHHLENGGAIFYVSFYDIIARIKYVGSDNAFDRFLTILNEFKIDKLRNRNMGWTLGITGTFPESGLVPTVFLYGFMGIDATIDGLSIRPSLPSTIQFAKVNNLMYHGKIYNITVYRDKIEIETKRVHSNEPTFLAGVIGNLLPSSPYLVINKDLSSGMEIVSTVSTNEEGELHYNLIIEGSRRIIFQPLEK